MGGDREDLGWGESGREGVRVGWKGTGWGNTGKSNLYSVDWLLVGGGGTGKVISIQLIGYYI